VCTVSATLSPNKPKRKPRKRQAAFPRKAQNAFVKAVLAAPSLAEAVRIIREKAAEFRPTGYIGWNEALTMLASGLETGRPRFRVIIRRGNQKLPFAAFSSIPVFRCPGAGHCARWCYSLKAWQYPTALCRQLQNTLLLDYNPEPIRDEFRKLPEGTRFRLYVDGDFNSAADVSLWWGLLAERPDVQAYGYSKSWDLLAGTHGPANYWLNLSSGGRSQKTSLEEMGRWGRTRGRFVSVDIEAAYHGTKGFERYNQAEYHRAVRESAAAQGLGKVFSCPGRCGSCTKNGPACALATFKDRVIAIGIHK
jgi:hypothetical protein